MSRKGLKTTKNEEKLQKNRRECPKTIKNDEKQTKWSKNRPKC